MPPPEPEKTSIAKRLALIASVLAVLALTPLLIWATLPKGGGTPKPAPTTTGGGGYFDAMIDARQKGRSTVAGVELTQFYQAFRMHALEYNDALPETLDDLAPYLNGLDQLLHNPQTGRNDRFVYTQPAANWSQIANPNTTVLVQETAATQPQRFQATLYADGHVELSK